MLLLQHCQKKFNFHSFSVEFVLLNWRQQINVKVEKSLVVAVMKKAAKKLTRCHGDEMPWPRHTFVELFEQLDAHLWNLGRTSHFHNKPFSIKVRRGGEDISSTFKRVFEGKHLVGDGLSIGVSEAGLTGGF